MSTDTPETAPEATETPVATKKGRASWSRRNILHVYAPDGKYRYKWVNGDPNNVRDYREMGYEIAPVDQEHHATNRDVTEGKPLTSGDNRREMVLMRIPREIAEEYDRERAIEAKRPVAALHQTLQTDFQNALGSVGGAGMAPLRGGVKIS